MFPMNGAQRSRCHSTTAFATLMLALAHLAPTVAMAAFEGIYEDGIDRPGGDYKSLPSRSVDHCMSECDQARESCVAFSWVAATSTCWLKNTLYKGVGANGIISGVKTTAFWYLTAEPDANRPGDDYKHFPLPSSNPVLCAEACQGESRCLAYTYVPPLNNSDPHCWLKDSKPEKTNAAGMVSGTKPSGVERRNAMTINNGTAREKARVFKTYLMVSANPQFCRQLCGTLTSCAAWNFESYGAGVRKPGGRCQLLAELGEPNGHASYASWTSGRRLKIFPRPHHPSATTSGPDIVGVFDGPGFVTRLHNRLSGFQGWGLVAMEPQGDVIAHLEDGYAIHPITGLSPRRFTIDTPTRIGSVSKAVTAVAVLRAERAKPGFLQTRLRDVLPHRWSLNQVFGDPTFEALLKHKSGLPNSGASLREVLADDATSDAGPGKYAYSNYGVETFNVTLAYALWGDFMQLIESGLEQASEQKYDETIRDITSILFRSYLATIFDKANIKVACHTSDRINPSWFYSENFKNYSDADSLGGGLDPNYHCAQGALVLTTRELARLFYKVVNTDEVLSDQEREYLMTPKDSLRLGLFKAPAHGNGELVISHNGAHPGTPALSVKDGDLGSFSELVIFPDGYVVAFNANSPLKEGVSAIDDIIAAYNLYRQGPRTPLFPPVPSGAVDPNLPISID